MICFLGGHGRSLAEREGAAATEEEEEEGTAELLNSWRPQEVPKIRGRSEPRM